MTNAKHDIRLIVRITEDSSFGEPYLKLATEVVYWNPEEDRWENCSSYLTPHDLRGYTDLSITAQADKYDTRLYGRRLAYSQPYRVELDDAKRMVATLAKVERKLAKLDAELGYAMTTPDFIIRVARAIGCHKTHGFGFYDKSSPSQDEQGYVWGGAETLKYRIRKAQDDFAKKFNIQPRED